MSTVGGDFRPFAVADRYLVFEIGTIDRPCGLRPLAAMRTIGIVGLFLPVLAGCDPSAELAEACELSETRPFLPYELSIPAECNEKLRATLPAPELTGGASMAADELERAEESTDRFYESLFVSLTHPNLAFPDRRVFRTDLEIPDGWLRYMDVVDVAGGERIDPSFNYTVLDDFVDHFRAVSVEACKLRDEECESATAASHDSRAGWTHSGGHLRLYFRFGDLTPFAGSAVLHHEDFHHADYDLPGHVVCPWDGDETCDANLEDPRGSVLLTIAKLQAAYLGQSAYVGSMPQLYSLASIIRQGTSACNQLFNHVVEFRNYVEREQTSCDDIVANWGRWMSLVRARLRNRQVRPLSSAFGEELRNTCEGGFSEECRAQMHYLAPLEDFFGDRRLAQSPDTYIGHDGHSAVEDPDDAAYEAIWRLLFAPVDFSDAGQFGVAPAEAKLLRSIFTPEGGGGRIEGFKSSVHRLVRELSSKTEAFTRHQKLLLTVSIVPRAMGMTKAPSRYANFSRALRSYLDRRYFDLGIAQPVSEAARFWLELAFLRGSLTSADLVTLGSKLDEAVDWGQQICEMYAESFESEAACQAIVARHLVRLG